MRKAILIFWICLVGCTGTSGAGNLAQRLEAYAVYEQKELPRTFDKNLQLISVSATSNSLMYQYRYKVEFNAAAEMLVPRMEKNFPSY